MNILEDFKAYNESLIWSVSNEYYLKKGIAAWSETSDKRIPHEVTTNYQNAIALAEIIKSNLDNYPKDYKVKVLECGAGSGRFSRNFLFAAKELGILEKIEFLVSDISKKNLEEIKERKILSDFKENDDYKFILLDITKPNEAKELSGGDYKLEKLSAISLNYVLDALPLTILKKEGAQYKELFLKCLLRADIEADVIENLFYQARIQKEYEWHDYDINKESQLEKDYKDELSFYDKKEGDIFYLYGALDACKKLTSLLDDHGFMLSQDIIPGQKDRALIVGNSIGHEIDNEFIASYLKKLNLDSEIHTSELISRIITYKKPTAKESFEKVFISENKIARLLELNRLTRAFSDKENASKLKEMLEETDELCTKSASNYARWGNYYDLIGDNSKAKEHYSKAKELDFWHDCDF